jgi:hypothetical protein
MGKKCAKIRRKMWIFLEAKLKLVSKEGIDNAYVMQCLPLMTEPNSLSAVKIQCLGT